MRLNLIPEVIRILHNPGDDQLPPTPAGGLDCQVDPLVGMNPPNKDQLLPFARSQGVERKVDSVVNGREVIQARCAIRIANGNEVSVLIFLVNRHDARRGEAVNRSQHRCLHQPRVGQRHKVIVTVDQVKLRGVFKGLCDVQVFGYLGIDGAILFVALVHDRMKLGAGERVPAGEQRYIPSPGHQPFSDVASHRLPSPILPRRRAPRNRRQNRDSLVRQYGSPSPATKAGCPYCPDFLWMLVALIHFMRLSLMKGAHADPSGKAWQEIGVKPFVGLSGITQHSTRFFCH